MPQQLLPQILVQGLVDLRIPPPHSDYEALHHYVPSFQQNLPFVINEELLSRSIDKAAHLRERLDEIVDDTVIAQ